jgi:hypothetical protein
MWGHKKGRTDIEKGVEVEVLCADSGALAVRREDRVRRVMRRNVCPGCVLVASGE